MDLANKYRAKYPPREHEEAVRMLLEGIANKKAQYDQETPVSERRKVSEATAAEEKVAAKEFDLRSLNSSTTTNGTSNDSAGLTSMRSKGTSTTSDSMSQEESFQSGDAVAYKKPIPSRTIAVQCELKSSSVQRDKAQFEAGMQASSISSTRYGFYTFSQETLDKRRKLAEQPSLLNGSSRNLNKTSLSSKQSDRNGGQQMEAPTSMSELSYTSSSRSVSEEDLRTRGRSSRPLNQQVAARSAHQMSTEADDDRSVARARLDSLPRRPMTALSYASASRLNHQVQSPSAGSKRAADQPSRLARNRAISHQVLTSQRTQPDFKQSQADELASSSDSELEGNGLRRSRSQYNDTDKFRVSHSEEMVVTNKAFPSPQVLSKPPRPTLLSSSHNEQVQDFDPRIWNSQPYVGPAEGQTSRSKTRLDQSYGSNERVSKELDDEENVDPHRDEAMGHVDASYRTNSMSRVRQPRAAQQVDASETDHQHRRASTLMRDSRAHSQTLMSRPARCMANGSARTYQQPTGGRAACEVSRSTSMRHMKRPESRLCTEPVNRMADQPMAYPSNTIGGHHGYRNRAEISEDSESSATRTWANPGTKFSAVPSSAGKPSGEQLLASRRSARSLSMRDVNSNAPINHHHSPNHRHHHHHHRVLTGCPRHERDLQQWSYQNSDGSECSSLELASSAGLHQVAGSHQLDYDSQHRLNESGLPDPADMMMAPRPNAPSSCLGMSSQRAGGYSQQQLAAKGRSPQVTGRAMSQQSLVRPSMPLSSGRRRGAVGTSNSGSDLGGSSMSLVSRLNGRYENAYTRSPVVMYIPETAPKVSQSLGNSRTSLARKSQSRSRLMGASGLVGGSKRSLQSRNGSDSEASTSSMLRTLVKPRMRQQQVAGGHSSPLVSRRSTRRRAIDYAQAQHNNNEDNNNDEYMDGIGHLATELDSYKFRRRYSVPKDAKINWFAKLKQRVSSGAK